MSFNERKKKFNLSQLAHLLIITRINSATILFQVFILEQKFKRRQQGKM